MPPRIRILLLKNYATASDGRHHSAGHRPAIERTISGFRARARDLENPSLLGIKNSRVSVRPYSQRAAAGKSKDARRIRAHQLHHPRHGYSSLNVQLAD